MAFFMIADSVKTGLVVTFHNLTLEQAAELEETIRDDFKDYSFTIKLANEELKATPNYWWNNNDGGRNYVPLYTPLGEQVLDLEGLEDD